MKVLITAAAGLKFMEQERLYKAILHHQSILIKTKFITIAFHLQQPISVAQRETLHMFCHTAFTSFTVCGLFVSVWTHFYLADTRSAPVFLFVILIVHTLCSLCPHSLQPSSVTSTFPQYKHFTIHLWTKLSPWKRRQYFHAMSEQIYDPTEKTVIWETDSCGWYPLW